MTLESPVSTFSTPPGTPARRASSARAKAVSGVDSAGFRMTCMQQMTAHIYFLICDAHISRWAS
jgi:hypothetical protein